MTIDDPVLLYLYEQLLERLDAPGRRLDVDPVQHGVKLTLHSGTASAAGTLYHSAKKKRISWVPNGKGDAALVKLLGEAVGVLTHKAQSEGPARPRGKHAPVASEKAWNSWIGSDEAGKGDIFGPLVVGAFRADRELLETLAALGVRDSKTMKRPAIDRIAAKLQANWPDRCTVVEVGPSRYNAMYPDFKPDGGINGILGWAHARAIRDLAAQAETLDGVIVDDFGGQSRVKRHLPRGEVKAQLVFRSRGESNLAVAAGAILARSRFEKALDRLGEKLGWRPHAGAGPPAAAALKRVAAEPGVELSDFVKMHFSTVAKLGLFE